MGEARRNIDLILFPGREQNTGPFSETWRAQSNINRDVQSVAFDDATEFCLWVTQLVVKPSQGPFSRARVIILDKLACNAEVDELCPLIGFDEKTSAVLVNFWTQLKNAR